MRIRLALATATLCFSAVGCACPRCPYIGYPIPPHVARVDNVNDFPDAPPEEPPAATQQSKAEKSAAAKPEQVTVRSRKTTHVATRSGVKSTKKSTAITELAKRPTVKSTPAAPEGAETTSRLLATISKPTVHTASNAKPANVTPAVQSRAPSRQAAGPALASVIEVAPPKAAKPVVEVAKSLELEPTTPPKLKQPGLVTGRGAKPRAKVVRPEATRKPPLQASDAPAAEAKQVSHTELAQ